jgi:hypothetical protein
MSSCTSWPTARLNNDAAMACPRGEPCINLAPLLAPPAAKE